MRAVRRWSRLSIVAFVALAGCATQAATNDSGSEAPPAPAAQVEPFYVFEAVEGPLIAARQQDERRYYDSNSLIVVGETSLAVIDAQAELERVEWLAGELAERFDARPIRELVFTHWHLDHSLGATVYRERNAELRVLAHAEVPALLASEGESLRLEGIDQLTEAIAKARTKSKEPGLPDAEAKDLGRKIEDAEKRLGRMKATPITLPDQRIADPTSLELAGVEARLIPVRAHTAADLIVYFPEYRVLATGDVLDAFPFAGHGHPREWLAVLRGLESLDIDAIVPGHGPVYRGKEHLRQTIHMWETTIQQVEKLHARGLDTDAIVEALPRDELRATFVHDEVDARALGRFLPSIVEAIVREPHAGLESLED
jgi:glyoxylase-like metal-dependent hydrolase (beta-lactamase superfamily II)